MFSAGTSLLCRVKIKGISFFSRNLPDVMMEKTGSRILVFCTIRPVGLFSAWFIRYMQENAAVSGDDAIMQFAARWMRAIRKKENTALAGKLHCHCLSGSACP